MTCSLHANELYFVLEQKRLCICRQMNTSNVLCFVAVMNEKNVEIHMIKLQYLLILTIFNKSTLDNSPPPLLNLKSLLRPQGQIIDVKCEK